MTDQNYTYPDKLGFGETLMFHIRVMSHELAQDGLDNEFEDLVDFLNYLVRPYYDDQQNKTWKDLNQYEIDVTKADDPIKWGKAKRFRCDGKMELAMDVLNTKGLLLSKVPTHDPDMEYYNDLKEGNVVSGGTKGDHKHGQA